MLEVNVRGGDAGMKGWAQIDVDEYQTPIDNPIYFSPLDKLHTKESYSRVTS